MKNLNTLTELNYWANLRHGSRSALFELYNAYYDDLYNYGFRISQDDSVTRDVIQDLFVELWTKCQRLPQVKSPRPYLLRMMRNMVLDKLKKYRKEIPWENAGFVGDAMEFSHQEMILTREMSDEKGRQLAGAINSLSPRQKEMIQLRFFHRCSYDEMVQITGVSYQSVRNSISRALKNLKALLVEDHVKLGN